MLFTNKIKWDTAYDVIVVGFGGAGATAARFAADDHAKVLLVDSAPEGNEGGNTRYCAGAFATGVTNFKDLKSYYLQSYLPFSVDEKVLNNFLNGVMNIKEYAKEFLGIEAKDPFASNSDSNGLALSKESISHAEYPEYVHGDAMQPHAVTTLYDGSFWKLLRKKVYDRLNMIDIWYDSPAEHLIQDGITKTVIGVQIKRHNQLKNILAKKGVVLALGGFENNQEMIQTYLGQGSLAPIGTLFNKGKGIDFAIEVGARLWHMSNYDSHGISLNEGKERERFPYMINWKSLFNGSIFIAGDDGSRFFREDEKDRHGYKYNHGDFRVLPNQNHAHIVMDQAQYDRLMNDKSNQSGQIKDLLSYSIKAKTVTELSKIIDAPKLEEAVADFNFFVDHGKDFALGRKVETMIKFDKGPFYAIPIRQNILHTHGGAERNENTQVISLEGNVIPHLFEAGELGDLFATKYIGASSVADLLISGRIAGTNAARTENTLNYHVDAVSSASQKDNDLKSDATSSETHFKVGPNQSIGVSHKGMGDLPIAVRITVDNHNKLANIETLQQAETDSIGAKAIPILTKKMLDKNSIEVDSVSGASSTSRAFKEAVSNAVDKLKK